MLIVIDEFKGEYRFLSNFWYAKVTLDGVEYPSVEHAYQAARTLSPNVRTLIKEMKNPGSAKKFWNDPLNVFDYSRSDWHDVNLDIMLELHRQKWQHPELRDKLLATGGALLVEGNWWHDNWWGDCKCDKCADVIGYNWLGSILMMMRFELGGELAE